MVVNFPNSQDEVTLIASKDNIKLKNYTEDIGGITLSLLFHLPFIEKGALYHF